MHTLETCLLKVTVSASLGMLLLWKVDFGLAPIAKYLHSFWLARILLILAYFHRRKSEGLDTKSIFIPCQMFMACFISGLLICIDDYFYAFGAPKSHVSGSAFLVSTQLVFSVGLGEQNCATYSIQVVVVLTIGVGIFNIGAGNDMPTRKSTDKKIIVPWIAFWTTGTCSLFIPWFTTLLSFHEETLIAILVFSTTLRICYMVNLHKAFVVLHSFEESDQTINNDLQSILWIGKQNGAYVLHLSYGIVITTPFNGIDVKKYVSLYESDTLLLLPLLYSNLEDKVLIEEGSIVVNTDSPGAGQAVGPRVKARRGPRIR